MARRDFISALRHQIAISIAKFQALQLRRYGQLRMSFYNNFDIFQNLELKKQNIGFVFQGPVSNLASAEYLERSIDELSKLVTPANIVVSSWKNDYERLMRLETKCGLVISDQELFATNHFRQLYSTHVGIQQFSEKKIEFIFKIRVDQRFNWKRLLLFMPNLLQEFGENRLIFMSNNSFKYRLFGLSDMFTFGTLKNSREFWNFDPTSGQELTFLQVFAPWFEQGQPIWSEAWFNLRYAISQNFSFSKNAWEDFIKYVQQHAIVADSSYFGHEWLKLNSHFEGSTEKMLFNEHPAKKIQEWSFMEWFGVYRGMGVSEVRSHEIL